MSTCRSEILLSRANFSWCQRKHLIGIKWSRIFIFFVPWSYCYALCMVYSIKVYSENFEDIEGPPCKEHTFHTSSSCNESSLKQFNKLFLWNLTKEVEVKNIYFRYSQISIFFLKGKGTSKINFLNVVYFSDSRWKPSCAFFCQSWICWRGSVGTFLEGYCKDFYGEKRPNGKLSFCANVFPKFIKRFY